MNPLLWVSGAGLLAGSMNALAGGGTFVTLPVLIAAGVPSVQANASSTVALLPGTTLSAWAYRDGASPVSAVSLRALALVTIIGGAIGAVLLLSTPTKEFDVLLPWLLLVATLMLAFGRRLGDSLRHRAQVSAPAVLAIQFVVGIYGGYFGGAVGLMMMAVWSFLGDRDFKSFNAPRTLLISAANVIAALTFIVARAVSWPETLAMMVGAMIGGYCGALIGRSAPPGIVRAITLLLSTTITLLFFVRAYRS